MLLTNLDQRIWLTWIETAESYNENQNEGQYKAAAIVLIFVLIICFFSFIVWSNLYFPFDETLKLDSIQKLNHMWFFSIISTLLKHFEVY